MILSTDSHADHQLKTGYEEEEAQATNFAIPSDKSLTSGDIFMAPPNLPLGKILVLDICAQIEDKCAELYHFFADHFAANPVALRLWRKTALEEEDHAIQIRFAARLRAEVIQDVTMDAWQAQNELKVVASILESVKTSPPSLSDALRIAIKLEDKLIKFHLNSMAIFNDEECSTLFTKMSRNDSEHVERLKKASLIILAAQELD